MIGPVSGPMTGLWWLHCTQSARNFRLCSCGCHQVALPENEEELNVPSAALKKAMLVGLWIGLQTYKMPADVEKKIYIYMIIYIYVYILCSISLCTQIAIDPPIHQSVHQSINQPIYRPIHLSLHTLSIYVVFTVVFSVDLGRWKRIFPWHCPGHVREIFAWWKHVQYIVYMADHYSDAWGPRYGRSGRSDSLKQVRDPTYAQLDNT